MKRLKLILVVIPLLFIISVVALANEATKKSLFPSSLFGDETLRSAVEHFQNNLNEFSSFTLSSLKTEWINDEKGRILFITQKDNNTNLDLKIENGMIQIKSKTEVKSDNSRSLSESSQMISVPLDTDENNAVVTTTDDGLKVFLPYKAPTKKMKIEDKNKRVPIVPKDAEIDI